MKVSGKPCLKLKGPVLEGNHGLALPLTRAGLRFSLPKPTALRSLSYRFYCDWSTASVHHQTTFSGPHGEPDVSRCIVACSNDLGEIICFAGIGMDAKLRMPSAKYGSGHLFYPGWVKVAKKTWCGVEIHFDWTFQRVSISVDGRQVAQQGFRASGGVRYIDLFSMASVLEPDASRSVVSCFTDVWAITNQDVQLECLPPVSKRASNQWIENDADDVSSMASFDPMDDDEDYMNDMMGMLASQELAALRKAGRDTETLFDDGGFINLPVCDAWVNVLPRWPRHREFKTSFQQCSCNASYLEVEVAKMVAASHQLLRLASGHRALCVS